MLVKISVCNRRTEKKYKNKELEWDYITDRNRNPVRTSETAEEYPKLPKGQRDDIKDKGDMNVAPTNKAKATLMSPHLKKKIPR